MWTLFKEGRALKPKENKKASFLFQGEEEKLSSVSWGRWPQETQKRVHGNTPRRPPWHFKETTFVFCSITNWNHPKLWGKYTCLQHSHSDSLPLAFTPQPAGDRCDYNASRNKCQTADRHHRLTHLQMTSSVLSSPRNLLTCRNRCHQTQAHS